MKEFEHPIDYALESALPRLQAWGLVTINSQVGAVTGCWRPRSTWDTVHAGQAAET
jgi:hypothetical protein